MLSGAQRGDAVLGVQMARHRHHHHLHPGIANQRREILVCGTAEPLYGLGAPLRQRIVHRGHPGLPGQTLYQPRMDAPPAAPEPGDANSQLRFHVVTIPRMSQYHVQR